MNRTPSALKKLASFTALALLLSSAPLPAGAGLASAQSDRSGEARQKQKSFGYRPETVSASPPGRVEPLSGPAQGKPFDIAVGYLRQNRQKLGLLESDLLELRVTDQYTSEHNGVTHIYLRQEVAGIEVVGAEVGTNVARDGKVINLHSSFVRGLRAAINRSAPALGPDDAVRAVAGHLGLTITDPLEILEAQPGPQRETTFSRSGISLEPITVKLVYQPVAEGRVRLAWAVEVAEPSAKHWWNIRVDAETGEVLAGDDYVDHDNWGENFAPDVERNRIATRAAAAPRAVTATAPQSGVVDGSAYNVFAMPFESPNDGGRTVVTNPADALASPYGWHDTSGAAGAEYTITRGNNVHAYLDTDSNGLPDTGANAEPNGGSGLQFNFPLDLSQSPASYRPAAVVNLFYWNNIVHDVFYRYGFTEAAGNFQVNNYGRGGSGNDDVRAEAQDGSGTNNANFATPADGSRPRMQMYVWTNPIPNTVAVSSPSPIAGNYAASGAAFGPTLNATGRTGEVVLALDPADASGPSTTDGCSALTNAGQVSGKIALIDRGTCSFTVKVKNAQNAGAIAAIIGNNVSGNPITMGGTDNTINIPSVMVRIEDANLYKANLPFNATVKNDPASALPSRDSDLDAGVIAHEYGHGISNRLTGGRLTTSCLGNQEQMGEGWSDYIGLVLTTAQSDTATTTRGIGTYVNFEPRTGVGIRPTPYTTDMTINPSTYDTIKTAAVPHGVGYVWATMLWEVYWRLVQKHGYNPNVYGAWNTGGNNLAIQLVTDGMKLQPCSPGFVTGRNAILQADQNLTNGANQCEIWSSFAKRGLGYSATQGSTNSVTDGTQAFDMPPGMNSTCSATIINTAMSVNAETGTYGGTVNLSATLTANGSGVGGQTVSFTLNGTSVGSAVTENGVATLSNVSLAGINAGTYPTGVGASFAGGGGYGPSSGSNSLTVNKANQTITVTTPAPASAAEGTIFTVAATASSGLPVTYGSSGSCSNNGATYTMTSSTGTCTVTYNQSGNGNYNAAPQVSQSVTATGGSPPCGTITLSPATLPAGSKGDSYSVQITASGGTPGYAFTAAGLPSTLSISGSGLLSGTLPTKNGNYSFTVTATDASGCQGSQAYTITLRGKSAPPEKT